MTLQIFTTKQRDLGGIPLDAVLEEEVETSLSVTTFPVERGADINDHAIIRPRFYMMRGVVTDTPGFKYWKVKYNHLAGSTRSTSAYAMLEDLQALREPLEILSGFRLYENMIITSLSTKRTEKTQGMIAFRAAMVELRVVKNQNVALDPDQYAETVRASAAPEKDLGVQQGAKASFAHKLLIGGS